MIANKSLRVDKISPAALKQIFLRQRTSIQGVQIVPINAWQGSNIRQRFRQHVLHMSKVEEARYWQARQIRGQHRAPTSFRNVLKAVFKVRGAIGYVPRSKYREGVARVLMVVPNPRRVPRSERGRQLTARHIQSENRSSKL